MSILLNKSEGLLLQELVEVKDGTPLKVTEDGKEMFLEELNRSQEQTQEDLEQDDRCQEAEKEAEYREQLREKMEQDRKMHLAPNEQAYISIKQAAPEFTASMVGSVPVAGQGAPVTPWIEELVEQLLVSNSALTHQKQVQINLKDSALPDTSILIALKDGRLNIKFKSNNTDSLRALRQGSAHLQEQLQNALDDSREIHLEIGPKQQNAL